MRGHDDGRPAWSRRQWMGGVGAALAAGTGMTGVRTPAAQRTDTTPPSQPLDVSQFEPHSMLRVPETTVPKARYPVIDIHAHLTFRAERAAGVPKGEAVTVLAPASELLPVMDRRNVRTMVNLTGGTGAGLATSVREFQSAHPGRFLTFTEPSWTIARPTPVSPGAGRRHRARA